MDTFEGPNCLREGTALSSCQLIVEFCPPTKLDVAVGEVTNTAPKADADKESAISAADSIVVVWNNRECERREG